MGAGDALRSGHGDQCDQRSLEHAARSAHHAGVARRAQLHQLRRDHQCLPAVSLERAVCKNVLLPRGDAAKNVREVEGRFKIGVVEYWSDQEKEYWSVGVLGDERQKAYTSES